VGGVTGARTLWRLTPQAAVLLIAAAIAWVAIIAWSPLGGAMAATMAFALPTFLVAWTVMMAAMMLPSAAPVASLYARSISGHRALRFTLFTGGYLVVWASASVLAFALGTVIAGFANANAAYGTAAGVGAYLACGLYQLSRLSNTAACSTAARRCRCSSGTPHTGARCGTSASACITADIASAAAGR
jgi:predicted metal-binding membrane protein